MDSNRKSFVVGNLRSDAKSEIRTKWKWALYVGDSQAMIYFTKVDKGGIE